MLKEILYYSLVAALLTSCYAKKNVVDTTVVQKSDTVVSYKEKIVYKSVKDTMYVENPCDSLGVLRDFQRSVITPQGTVEIKSDRGSVKAVVNLIDTQDIKEESVITSVVDTKTDRVEEIVKYRTPFWLILYAIGVTALCLFLLKARIMNFFKFFL